MNTYKEALNELNEQQTLLQKKIRWNYLFIGAYAVLIIVFLAWGGRFYKEIAEGYRLMFGLFMSLPIIGLVLEAVSLKKRRDRLDILKWRQRELALNFDNDSSQQNEEAINNLTRNWMETDHATLKYKSERNRVLVQIIIAVCWILMRYYMRDMKKPKEESSLPMFPTSSESYEWDSLEEHRADSSSDRRVSDIPEHASTDDWMKDITIPAQTLYEDSLITCEVTGYKVKRNNIEIKMSFTNHSDYNIRIENPSGHDRVNHVGEGEYLIYIRTDLSPGETADDEISVSDHDIPWYDSSLKELEFMLQVYNTDEEDGDSGQALLLETSPLIIRTEPAEGISAQDDLLLDNEMKILYESDEVRVIRTGIFDRLWIKDGTPNYLSSTYWEILIENMSQGEVEIKDAVCTVNDRNALWDSDDPDKVWGTVPADQRGTVEIPLIGGMPDDETLENVTSYMELVGALRMPLEDIETSSLSFDLNYVDASGTPVSVSLSDSYCCFTGN